MSQRLNQLIEFLEKEPNDPFLLYAIAMEYANTDQEQKAVEYYDRLLKEHSSYLPTYYHAAHFFAELDQVERAKEVFEAGIALAKLQKEEKTLRELQNAFNNFLFELDDEW
ncbi:MAG: tetratricopeptide repeat protein [Flammeovirgaceae bacterium]